MINVRNIVYFIVAAVILLALAAIIASRWGGASSEIQYTTCTQTEDEQDFDLVVEHIAAAGGEGEVRPTMFDVRVSGEDFHMIIGPDAVGAVGEYMVKDGVHYGKKVGGEWEINEEPEEPLDRMGEFIWELIDSRPNYMQFPSEHILCPIEGEDFRVTKIWFDEVIPGPVYVWGHDWESVAPAYAEELPDIKARWEYWPTMDGHLHKSVQFFDVIGGERKTKITTNISDLGVPNVITAPVVQ